MRNLPRWNPVESGRIGTRLARDWRALYGRPGDDVLALIAQLRDGAYV